ncbi:uncharacterized protein LOC131219228 isoform X2 [Magnolia sinica]|uniref:uncharacterized protein LOC131219228 isoform X2 n=1 Tax=Magnolia sinica TaxID=86752 RepID=UPI002658EFAB|nr:uncharacterized protein LOC131219228 isoform X2 [Magnolia sinica]
MATLVYSRSFACLLKPMPTPMALHHSIKKYRQCSESAGVIGEKARSTAEEFKRQEKEKAESATHSGKEARKEVKDVVSSESQTDSELAKEKFKENVEKGSYDKMGRE